MLEREMAEKNKILEIKIGSYLYGLENEDSDLDYGGIFLPSKDYVLGFKSCNEVDFSTISKDNNGKNTKDAIDRKLYEFRKFVSLAMNNNPNIMEYLFVDKKNIVFINEYGKRLLEKSELFPHKGLKKKFVSYAISQKKKMMIKKENFLELENGEKFLLSLVENGEDKLLLPQCDNYKDFTDLFKIKKQTDNHYRIGDIMLVKNQTVKKTIQVIRKRIGEKSNRKELIREKGYDYKFAYHLIRLLLEGKELLETSRITFPLKNKKELMAIKTGKWSLEEVLEYSEILEDEINIVEKSSKLPSNPRVKELEKFTMELLEDWLF